MRKISFILLPFLSFLACTQSPVDKAKHLINERLRNSLNDYKSYDPVKFDSLDTAYTKIQDNPRYTEMQEKFKEYNKDAKQNLSDERIYLGIDNNKAAFYLRESKKDLDSMERIDSLMGIMRNSFRKRFAGWTMVHSFRAKNLAGNLGMHHYQYFFDSAFTEIIKQVDVSESAINNDNK